MQSNPAEFVASTEGSPVSSDGERVALAGLDQLFEEESVKLETDNGLTLGQAEHYYGLPAREIKTKIKLGEIAGRKLGRKNWRVYPLGLPARVESQFPQSQATEPPFLLPPTVDPNLTEAPPKDVAPLVAAPETSTVSVPKETKPRRKLPQRVEADVVIEPVDVQVSPLTLQLQAKVAELEAKLEAAAYRNGYLEAKLEWAEGQVKLLSHQPKVQSALQKFFALFK